MTARLIDLLARQAARRRVALGTGGALLGLVGEGRAAACGKVGKKCDKNKDCCHGATCKGKHCACKGTLAACDGRCVDIDSDDAHCGGCGNACGAGRACCAGGCVDTSTSDGNCGACGTVCPATQECVAGRCTTPNGGCAPGADSCANGGNSIPCAATGSGCICSQSTEGTTVCGFGNTAGAACGQCDTTEDCIALVGAGAFCVRTSGGCCGPTAQNVCRLSC